MQASRSATGENRLLIVSPVRNEARQIECVIRAMAAQTRPPDLWLVADDSSDDGTLEILREHEKSLPFLQVVEVPPFGDEVGPDRLAQALPPRAFNRALAHVDWTTFTHLGKLDGDIELPPDYFERILGNMQREPRLGIAGGSIVEPIGPGGSWKRMTAPSYHVHGALKLFSRECFEAVGGIEERLGWDTIDETYARMRGFETRRDEEVVARHHRPTGSADGKLRGRMRHGHCAYIVRYPLSWVLLRSVKIGVRQRPRGVSGAAFAAGFLRARATRADRVDDPEFADTVAQELRSRVWSSVWRRKPAVRAGS